MTRTLDPERQQLLELIQQQRREQGLPPQVSDPVALRKLAALATAKARMGAAQ